MSGTKNNEQKELPFPRVSLEKQIEIVKGVAIIYGATKKGSSPKDVASKVGTNVTTISSVIKFWKETGFLTNDDLGYVPSKALIDFNQRIQWGDEDSAWEAFCDVMENTWFLNEIKITFQLKPKLSVDDLTKSLGMASGRQNKDVSTTRSIQMLIQLLELSKIIEKDSDGNYNLKSNSAKKPKEIVVDNSKDLIQVRIVDELYAVDINDMKNFVIEKGKKINDMAQKVE